MSHRSKVKIYPLLKRREPSRSRALLGSKQSDLMSVSLARRRAVVEKFQIEFPQFESMKKPEPQHEVSARTLFVPRFVRR